MGKVEQVSEMYLWRTWGVFDNRLSSVAMRYTWPAEPEPARCYATERKPSVTLLHRGPEDPLPPLWCYQEFSEKRLVRAPSENCGCGYYGHYRPQAIALTPRGIYGIIRVWGTVQRHSFGARAQFARPELLWIKNGYALSEYRDLRDSLAEYYRCPVVLALPDRDWQSSTTLILNDIETYRPDLYSFVKDTIMEGDSYGTDW